MKPLSVGLLWTFFMGSLLLLAGCGGAPSSPEDDLRASTSGALTTMVSPTPGSTLGDSATFTWTDTGATSYALWVGSSLGTYNIYSNVLSTTSTTVATLPVDGSTVYVRLFDKIGGVWSHNDYTYTATSATTPALTSPAAGTTFSGNSATFSWSAGSPTAAEYGLWVGSTPGSYDVWARSTLGTATTVTAAGLPLDGRDLYVRLYFRYGTSWYHAPDVLYHAHSSTTTYAITSPTNGSTFTASSQAFTFTSGAADYALWVGTAVGKYDIFARASTGGVASVTATNLPIDGSTVYVRFWYELGTTWYKADYTYTAWTASSQHITAPTAGSTLSSSSVQFAWTGGADEYALWIGSGVGQYDIWARSLGTATSAVATKLPKNGSTLYVRFKYRFGTSWYYQDTTYTSCTGTCSAKVLSFASAVNYSAGNGPEWVATGDFNGDNKVDFAVANYTDKNVSVLLGNGDGTFQAPVNYALGNGPVSVVTGDFNGDNKADLALAKYSSNNVAVLLGNGDGTFQAAVNTAAGTHPTSVTVGDFNGDTKKDLAVANQGSNNVTVLLGNGNGTFAAAVNYATGTGPTSIATGDFNGDTKADLAVANSLSNDVSILLGNGDGTFGTATSFAAGTGAYGVTVADLNGDTKPDVAVANYTSNDVSILLGNGDGTFQAAVSYSAGTGCYAVTTADFNGDGNKDLAIANGGSDNVSVILGNGDGTFQAATNYTAASGVVSVATADLNGDGMADLAATNYTSNNVSVLLNTSQ